MALSMDEKIKICILAPAVYPLLFPEAKAVHGGAELQLWLIARELNKEKSFEIHVVVGNFSQNKKVFVDNVPLIRGITLKGDDSLLKKMIQAIRLFFLLLKLNPDVLITSSANSTVGLFAFYAKLFRKKFIYRTAHSMDVNGEWIKKNGLLGKIYRYGLLKADVVLTQHQGHKQLLWGNYQIQAVIFPNCFEINQSIPKEKSLILFVARAEEWKNPEAFLALAREFPKEKFKMVLPKANDAGYFHDIQTKADTIDNLDFSGYIPYDKIQHYFDIAKVFVNTSFSEGFPNTFLQAAIAKTPLLSLHINPDNFIDKYNCGFYCEGQEQLLIQKLHELINNQAQWQEKSNNIYDYVQKKHDISKNINILKEKIYNL